RKEPSDEVRSQRSLAEQPGLVVREVQHRRGHAGQRCLLAQVHVDQILEGVACLLAGAAGRFPRRVRARHGQRTGRGEQGQRERMTGDADADRLRVAAQVPVATLAHASKDEGEGPRPQADRETLDASVEPGDAPQGRRGRAEHGKLEGAGASLRVEQAARGRGVVGSRADAVDRVRREHHELAAPSGGRSLRDGILAHRPSFWTAAAVRARGLSLTDAAGWAWTTRSRPLRSDTTRSTTNPRASATPETSRPRDSAISTTAVPPGRSHAAACAKNRSYSS